MKKHLEFTSFCYSGQVLEFLESCPELKKHLCIEKVLELFLSLDDFPDLLVC
ncbi:hypothetical protein Hanom_Chr10g00931231 [Helianthus anomalus]